METIMYSEILLRGGFGFEFEARKEYDTNLEQPGNTDLKTIIKYSGSEVHDVRILAVAMVTGTSSTKCHVSTADSCLIKIICGQRAAFSDSSAITVEAILTERLGAKGKLLTSETRISTDLVSMQHQATLPF